MFYVDVEPLLSLASLRDGGLRCTAVHGGPRSTGTHSDVRKAKASRGRWGRLREQRRVVFKFMLPLKAHLKNGRLVLDDPTTDLPEGSEVELVVAHDEFDPEERARLLEAIEAGAADLAGGD